MDAESSIIMMTVRLMSNTVAMASRIKLELLLKPLDNNMNSVFPVAGS